MLPSLDMQFLIQLSNLTFAFLKLQRLICIFSLTFQRNLWFWWLLCLLIHWSFWILQLKNGVCLPFHHSVSQPLFMLIRVLTYIHSQSLFQSNMHSLSLRNVNTVSMDVVLARISQETYSKRDTDRSFLFMLLVLAALTLIWSNSSQCCPHMWTFEIDYSIMRLSHFFAGVRKLNLSIYEGCHSHSCFLKPAYSSIWNPNVRKPKAAKRHHWPIFQDDWNPAQHGLSSKGRCHLQKKILEWAPYYLLRLSNNLNTKRYRDHERSDLEVLHNHHFALLIYN